MTISLVQLDLVVNYNRLFVVLDSFLYFLGGRCHLKHGLWVVELSSSFLGSFHSFVLDIGSLILAFFDELLNIGVQL